MKKIQMVILLGCLFASVNAFSQDTDSDNHRSLNNGLAHGVGVGGAVGSTWGFTYRKFFPSQFGFNANLGGAFTSTSNHVGATIGGMYTLFHNPFPSFGLKDASVRVYITAAITGMHDRDRQAATPADERNAFVFGGGVGPGIEYFLGRNFAVNLDVPWMTRFRAHKNAVNFDGSAPSFGFGLTYYI